MKPVISLQHSQEAATCPYPIPDIFIIRPNSTSCSSILILSSFLRLGLPSGYFPQAYPPKQCMHLSFLLYLPHAPPDLNISYPYISIYFFLCIITWNVTKTDNYPLNGTITDNSDNYPCHCHSCYKERNELIHKYGSLVAAKTANCFAHLVLEIGLYLQKTIFSLLRSNNFWNIFMPNAKVHVYSLCRA